MDPRAVAQSHFDVGKVLQIATLHDGKPRVNSVYYTVSDDYTAVYWMSEKRRRHSIDIEKDASVAGAIAAKTDWPVAGLQFQGKASEVTDPDEVKLTAEKYGLKYNGISNNFYKWFIAGTAKHRFYKMTISNLELFDEVNFPGGEVVSIPLQ